MNILKIYGPPGTGKTTRLVELLEQELKTTAPARVAFLTFTRAARLEALSRLQLKEDDMPFMRTIHSICYRQLGLTHDQLVTAKALADFGRQVNIPLSGRQLDPWIEDAYGRGWEAPTEGDLLVQYEHLRRHRGQDPETAWQLAPLAMTRQHLNWFTATYEKWKEREALTDYTDMLTDYVRRGHPLPIDVAFVDEAQDLSWLQWCAVDRMIAHAQRLFVAGDDDQCIFSWAGASARHLNQIQAQETVVLPQSYRVPRKIFDVAKKIIARVKDRQPKVVKARDAEGEVRHLGYLASIRPDVKESTLILYRNGHRGVKMADKLIDLAVPFTGSKSPLDHAAVKQVLQGWKDLVDGQAIKNTVARAVLGAAALNWVKPGAQQSLSNKELLTSSDLLVQAASLDDWSRALPQLPYHSYLSAIILAHGWDVALNPPVKLLSIHQSKGREADTVVLDTDLARKTFDHYMMTPEDEHRVFYVAVTRARERLWVLLPETQMNYEL